MLGQQEKNLLINAISIRLNRLQTILDQNLENNGTSVNFENSSEDILVESSPGIAEDTLLEFAKQEKSQLLDNLHWAKSEEAGICQACGDAIPIRRLLTVPTTRTCTSCTEQT